MLARAERLCEERGWGNVTLDGQDAEELDVAPGQDAALFSLSYSVIPQPRRALARAWEGLRPGGQIVIMDGGLPGGPLGAIVRPWALALSKATVRGDLSVRPWDDLAVYTDHVEIERLQLGTYYICHASKR
jgi:SAM-dependent methyltransferase